MEKTGKKRLGLIGKDISYSFSQGYFTEKFNVMKIEGFSYENFDLQNIQEIASILKNPEVFGLNVTIPYKEQVLPYLDELDKTAQEIGAVNTIKFIDNKRIGFNTDTYGFKNSITPLLNISHKNALILGTGGASKAIAYVFKTLGIAYTYVSRSAKPGQLSYIELDKEIITSNTIIVNCSPVGTFPNVAEKPNIPYEYLGKNHVLFDLIYNPEVTAFLAEGKKKGCVVQNGYPMLVGQAEKAWEIWNS